MSGHKDFGELRYVMRAIDREWEKEKEVVAETFAKLLADCTGDGSKKRQSGTKPPWWRDPDHEPALFSHLNRWKHGELVDGDSGAHPLVHLAWRALAIAYQETYGCNDPAVPQKAQPDYVTTATAHDPAECDVCIKKRASSEYTDPALD